MKLLLIILSFINGAYMFIDGIFVMLKGKYIGPEKPGPWAVLFTKLNIDVFRLGPLFILFGLLWLFFGLSLLTSQSRTYLFGIILSIATLWYFPVGTLICLLIFITLLVSREALGL